MAVAPVNLSFTAGSSLFFFFFLLLLLSIRLIVMLHPVRAVAPAFRRSALLLLLLTAWCLTAAPAQAQAPPAPYGNEWIQYGQPYYKLKVLQRGIYRLSNAYLAAAGVPLAGLDPRQLQVWRRGREQAIYVAGEADGTFDGADYVEFFGEPNDGAMDTELYKDPTDQLSHLAPIYTDSAAYFLTIAPTPGRRMTASSLAPTGLTPLNRHLRTVDALRLETYQHGYWYDRNQIYQPWLDAQEGYSSTFFAAASTNTVTGQIAQDSSSQAPSLELTVLGVGFSDGVGFTTFDVQVVAGPTNAAPVLRTLGSYRLPIFSHITVREPLRFRDLTAGGQLYYRVVITNTNVPFNFLAIHNARLRYVARNVWSAGPGGLIVRTDSTQAPGPQYLLFNTPPAAAVAYDVTDPTAITRLTGQTVSTQWGVVVPGTGPASRRVVVVDDAAPLVPSAARRVPMRAFAPLPNAYLLVTNRRLLLDATTGARPVRDYAEYRASPQGGRYDTVVALVDQLYDEFHYGDRSPNGIRRFTRFMSSGGPTMLPKALFLVGKGLQPDPGSVAFNRGHFDKEMVPAGGFPASDIIFTADFRNGRYEPTIPTGRLAALTPAQITGYLEKVRAHELTPDEPWRKDFLHLSGGRDPGQFADFLGYINGYKRRVEDSLLLGGRVQTITRANTGQYVDDVNVADQINRGLSMVTYFGHSSTTISDINIGVPSNPVNGYNNAGRYPLLLMNGCASGNAFFDAVSFGEDWVLTPNRGALGFLAYGGEGYGSMLDVYTDSFYKAAFNDSTTFGKPVGVVQQHAIELAQARLGGASASGSVLAHLTEMVLQMDPATALFAPAYPDYAITDASLGVRPLPGQRLTARADSIQVTIAVRNLGRVTTQQIRVQVTRRVGGTLFAPVEKSFPAIFYADTLRFTIANPADRLTVQGLNQLDVFIDAPGLIRELNENNNRASISFTLPSGSVFPLYPPEFAIIPGARTITLTGQYDQVLAQPRPYTFQLDTVPTFRSGPGVHRTATITAGRYPVWQPTLPVFTGAGRRDSVVWYWRFRPQTLAAGEDTAWATSSFRYVPGSPGGWSQSHYGQFARTAKTTIRQAIPSGKWDFTPARLALELRTATGAGGDTTTFALPEHGIFFNGNDYRIRSNCGLGGSSPRLLVMAFDGKSLELLQLDSIRSTATNPNNFAATDLTCGQPGVNAQTNSWVYRTRSLRDSTNWRDLIRILHLVPKGAYVTILSTNRVPFPEMPNYVKAAFRNLGSVLSDSLREGDPFALVARKGTTGLGTLVAEKTWDPSQPRRNQVVTLRTTITTASASGRVASTVIGPARRWRTFYHTARRQSVDTTATYRVQVIPVDGAGRDGTPLVVTATSGQPFDLAAIPATQYPKLRLVWLAIDSANRKAPQLRQWLVTYDAVPEGIVRPDLLTATQLDLTPQTDSGYVRWVVPFQNISAEAFPDSLLTSFSIVQANQTVVAGPFDVKVPPLAPGAIARVPVRRPVNRLVTGSYILQANVNPNAAQPEQYLFNNQLAVPFRVINPNMAPLVDVAVDGQHLLHGDIVAPSPTITVSVRDEDHQLPMDPNQVKLFFTRPGPSGLPTGTPEQIAMNSPGITIQRATGTRPLEVTWKPGTLPDGLYRLQVQATDPAGNQAGAEPYAIEFKVINETMISNFYPYPNPFSTNTRFLFTVTGKVPQNLKIQVMTVTGRVVRELTKADLGADLRVGNNATTNTWDGTDEYGDKLANGVYLYRVVVQDDQEQFKAYKTTSDSKLFQHNWGKLYILR